MEQRRKVVVASCDSTLQLHANYYDLLLLGVPYITSVDGKQVVWQDFFFFLKLSLARLNM
jgi:hypothetical protein